MHQRCSLTGGGGLPPCARCDINGIACVPFVRSPAAAGGSPVATHVDSSSSSSSPNVVGVAEKDVSDLVQRLACAKKRAHQERDKKYATVEEYQKKLRVAKEAYNTANQEYQWIKTKAIVDQPTAPPPKKRNRQDDDKPQRKHAQRLWKDTELVVLRYCGQEVDYSLDSEQFYLHLHGLFSAHTTSHARNLSSICKKAKEMGILPSCCETKEEEEAIGVAAATVRTDESSTRQ